MLFDHLAHMNDTAAALWRTVQLIKDAGYAAHSRPQELLDLPGVEGIANANIHGFLLAIEFV
jgi:hypothetical protein